MEVREGEGEGGRKGGTKKGKESQIDSRADLGGAGMLKASTQRAAPTPCLGVNANVPPVKPVLSLAKENLVPPCSAFSIG